MNIFINNERSRCFFSVGCSFLVQFILLLSGYDLYSLERAYATESHSKNSESKINCNKNLVPISGNFTNPIGYKVFSSGQEAGTTLLIRSKLGDCVDGEPETIYFDFWGSFKLNLELQASPEGVHRLFFRNSDQIFWVGSYDGLCSPSVYPACAIQNEWQEISTSDKGFTKKILTLKILQSGRLMWQQSFELLQVALSLREKRSYKDQTFCYERKR